MRRRHWHRKYTERYLDHDIYEKDRSFKPLLILFIIIVSIFIISFIKSNSEIFSSRIEHFKNQGLEKVMEDSVNGIENIVKDEILVLEPDYDFELMERQIHEGINKKRVENGLSKLDWNSKLNSIAREHSEDMSQRNYFAHGDFEVRYERAGFNCKILVGDTYYLGAENLYQHNKAMYTYEYGGVARYNKQERIVSDIVEGWMQSKGHRENILTSYWQTEGIGIAVNGRGEILVTQNFC